MEIQEEKVMWIRKIGLGILIGVVLCSVMVNAEERNSRKAESMTKYMERRKAEIRCGKCRGSLNFRQMPG